MTEGQRKAKDHSNERKRRDIEKERHDIMTE
jgi:hypothetical protein